MDEANDEIPDHVLEALEWLATSASHARSAVAEAVRTIDEATARETDGRQV